MSTQVWVPAVYSSPGIYLVKHPISLGWYGASAILLLGLLSIWANFDADRQRHAFRQARTLHRVSFCILPLIHAGRCGYDVGYLFL